MKKFWIKKGLMFLVIFIAAVTAFGFIVMGLWNAILPAVLGVKVISFWQALGILALSKILFGGFGGRGHWRGSPAWKEKMKQRWDKMTPDEREKFKAEWKNRCGGRWTMKSENDTASSMSAE
jgi:Ca2+/H+ antiporter, TMEM165/GDT1 family